MTPYTNAAARDIAATILASAQLANTQAASPQLDRVDAAIVLGSGLGGLVDELDAPLRIPYADIPGLSDIHVAGQAGQLVVGTLAAVPVVVLSGRFHVYEGHTPQLAGFPIRIAHALGARTLLVTNAAGGINRAFTPGDLMIIADHLNMTGASPLVGPLVEGDTRFPDMSDPYDTILRDALKATASQLGIPIKEGVYAGVLGPAYETRSEIRMLHLLGADAVGMSTIPEVLVARALGMRVAGVSCITNMASGIQETPLDHADVLRGAARIAAHFQSLVREFIRRL